MNLPKKGGALFRRAPWRRRGWRALSGRSHPTGRRVRQVRAAGRADVIHRQSDQRSPRNLAAIRYKTHQLQAPPNNKTPDTQNTPAHKTDTHTRSTLRAKAVHPPQQETSRGIGFRKLVQALNSGYPVPLRTSPELPVMGLAEYPGRFAPFPLSGGLEPAAGGLKQSPPAGTRPQNISN